VKKSQAFIPFLCVGLPKTANSSDVYETEKLLRRMPSSGMLRCVALVITDVLEEPSASIIRVTRIS
jgi:hypothetical protein